MKKFCAVAAFAIVLQIFFFIWRSFQYPVDEDFWQFVKKYEGLRYTEAREQVNADKSQISERNFERIMAQIDWMEDVEHSHVTAYLPQAEKGYVYVEIPKEKSGIEGLAEEKAIPLLVYREGYKELFGVGEEILHYVQAIFVIILIAFLYDRKEKETLRRRALDAVIIGGIVYLPELIWVFVTYGFPGLNYPGISVGEIGGFPIIGVIRTMYLMRGLGIFTLGYLILFLNRLLWKRRQLVRLVLFVFYMLPVFVGIVVALVNSDRVFLCGLSDVLVAANVLKFDYEYMAILLILNIVIIVVCKFYPVYHYSEDDIKRMEQHFKG